MTGPRIAILSMACRFPEADSPAELWSNVQEGRRAFRPIPSERLPLQDYAAARVGLADSIPSIPAGLISDWAFDRARFRVPRATFEATDLTHWLALETADDALRALGGAGDLPRDRCITVIGNTMTGEFTRSSQIRLRLPYLTRVLQDALASTDLPDATRNEITAVFANDIRTDFADPNEESLAGALANTIAGRIANHNDFHGGAWTVDGACASSLLAISDACTRLTEGSADVAIAGGVDLSLDPFELVGFARAGALARDVMRVFDRRASGFWPGEGCGMAVLATEEIAHSMGAEPMAWIRGWGVSTDGAGGLTRPTESGQARTLRRAWGRAGLPPGEAGFFEAHGTGTAVGDPVELRGLAKLVGGSAKGIPVGSIKANIGHCKAAAGMAGFIKSVEALRAGQVPMHVSCDDPAEVFSEIDNRLSPAEAGILKGHTAGVSGFGFGGVNSHVVLEQADRPFATSALPMRNLPQDCEVFLLSADTTTALKNQLEDLSARTQTATLAELRDLAARLARSDAPYRAAIVAAHQEELRAEIEKLLDQGPPVPKQETPPKVGFIFPGQAAPVRPTGGIWAKRFSAVYRDLHLTSLSGNQGDVDTAIAQPAIVQASLVAMQVLERLGIRASVSCGHSLGEVSALAWAEVFSPKACVELARARGAAMAQFGAPDGGMVRLQLARSEARDRAAAHGLSLACENGSEDMILSGSLTAISALRSAYPSAEPLKVSHAFHCPDMAAAAQRFRAGLEQVDLKVPTRPVLSSVSGQIYGTESSEIPHRLVEQFTQPVLFADCLETLRAESDFLIEVGAGAGLTRLAKAAGLTCISVDAAGSSIRALLQVVGEAWLAGVDINASVLFEDRPCRAVSMKAPDLLANACGHTADQHSVNLAVGTTNISELAKEPSVSAVVTDTTAPVEVVREVAAQELGLEITAIPPQARLLDDLHLNSLSVGRIVDAAAARLGIAPPAAGTDLAQVSIAELAAHLEELRVHAPAKPKVDTLEGVGDWVAEYETEWTEETLPTDAVSGPWAYYGAKVDLECTFDPEAERALVVMDPDQDGPTLSGKAATVLWERVQSAKKAGQTSLTILHRGMALSGFARSLLAETAFRSVATIDMAETPDVQKALDCARAITAPFAELRLDGTRILTPRLRASPVPNCELQEISPADNVLVTGGARGIAAECGLALAQSTGCSIVLSGRSGHNDASVTALAHRAEAMGITFRYCQLDLRDAPSVAQLFQSLRHDNSAPSVIVHAAGVNTPEAFAKISENALQDTLAPKVEGLSALLTACDPDETRLVVGFGSIIGALGLAGETHYALANDIQSAALVAWGAENDCRVLALDWSVWAGAGMGERLGVVERLASTGVQAIPLTSALARFCDLVQDVDAHGRMIVTSRFGPPEHTRFAPASNLPEGRFISESPLHYPSIELINDVELNPGSDPWMEDHVVDGHAIVPGVMLLEAMAQTAAKLTGWQARGLSDVRFDHAVSAQADGSARLRIAARRRDDGAVDIVVRSNEDDYSADRACATLWPAPAQLDPPSVAAKDGFSAAPLYDALWFNSGRFARLDRIETAHATSLRARFKSGPQPGFFGAFQSQALLLGDPGLRDSGLHALQLCVAQRRVLPIRVERIAILRPEQTAESVEAVERSSDGTRFCFDLTWKSANGIVTEIWSGAWFKAVGQLAVAGLPDEALPPLLERAIKLVSDDTHLKVALTDHASKGLARLGITDLTRRGDGAPQSPDGSMLSRSYACGLVLSVSAKRTVACDLVDWKNAPHPALGPHDLISAQKLKKMGVSKERAEAIVWAGRECLRKAGSSLTSPLLALETGSDGVIGLRSGGFQLVGIALDSGLAAVVAFQRSHTNADYPSSLRELGAAE